MALMGYNYNADRIKPSTSTYIQTNSYNNVDVKNIDFGALFGALKRETAAELLLSRFSVEVVGFEPATPCLQSMCSTS